MPVWPGVMTLALGALTIPQAARKRWVATAVGVLFWIGFCALWALFTFREVLL